MTRTLILTAVAVLAGCSDQDRGAAVVRSRQISTAHEVGLREDMIAIPGGEFIGRALACAAVGVKPGEPAFVALRFEKQRTPAFAIDRRVVSCDDFRACVRAGACHGQIGICTQLGAVVPLERAAQYCKWRDARLPHYAEWQRAARGTDGNLTPTGDSWDPAVCGDQYARCPIRNSTGFEYYVNGGEEWTSDIACDDIDPARRIGPVRVSLATTLLTEYRADKAQGATFRCVR